MLTSYYFTWPSEKLDDRQHIWCPARDSDLSAATGQSRLTVTAFLRRTNIDLRCTFKPPGPGTMGAARGSFWTERQMEPCGRRVSPTKTKSTAYNPHIVVKNPVQGSHPFNILKGSPSAVPQEEKVRGFLLPKCFTITSWMIVQYFLC